MNRLKLRTRYQQRSKESYCKQKVQRKCREKVNKISDRNVIEAIKCFSGSGELPRASGPLPSGCQVQKSTSESSVIYVGTYMKADMPRTDSIVDLTRSDTSLFSTWDDNCNVERYDISGDNIVDELRFREYPPTSTPSIYTIYPPKSPSIFSTPSDELCACPQDISMRFCKKRNRSASDTACENTSRVKRLACSKSKPPEVDTDSVDNVWTLKRTFPLHNVCCARNTKSGTSMDNMLKMKVDCNLDLMNVSDSFDGIRIVNSQHATLAQDMKCLKVTNTSDV